MCSQINTSTPNAVSCSTKQQSGYHNFVHNRFRVGHLNTTNGKKCQSLPWGCGGGWTLTLPPGPAAEFGGREPTAIPDKRWGRFTAPATGGIRLGASVFGDAIPRASYARLMSEGEGFGWLFGAWLGTVTKDDTDANNCRQQQIQMNTLTIKPTRSTNVSDYADCLPTGSWWNILNPTASSRHNLYDLYLLLCVQC